MRYDERVERIVSEKMIKVGERFDKKYLCFNCFSHITGIKLDRRYTGHMNLMMRARLDLEGRDAIVWVPRINNELEYNNEVLDNENTIIMSRLDGDRLNDYDTINLDHSKRYTFTRFNDRLNREIFEFVGLFFFDKAASDNYKQVWRRTPENEVSLDI